MVYISKEQAADIRARLKAEFPAKHGWKFSVRIDGRIALRVGIVQSPVPLIAYEFDAYAHDDATPKSTGQAKILGRVKRQETGDINQHWYDSHYAAPTVAVLERIIGIVMRYYWDKSDIQTDYFHCAWYQTIHVGKDWETPLVYAPPDKARAWLKSSVAQEIRTRADEIEKGEK